MEEKTNNLLSKVLFIPHGGGPLPLLGDKGHQELVDFLKHITPSLGRPSAILVISAHWEEDRATITGGETPALIYDYAGFPDEAYKIKYPASGNPQLAKKIFNLLQSSGVEAKLDNHRGFDHGLFIPLKIMFPDASIPCVQLSLLKSLDPKEHIRMGKALSELRNENLLIIGSGFSFHNMSAFFQSKESPDEKNEDFERWLINTCTDNDISENERERKLAQWSDAPFARYCHPREEHLLPLHVCYGTCSSTAKLVFDGKVIGKKASAFLW
ncbi:dioxygenase [Methyloprofundus sedimenti]|uniref:Dioxygenase n=1 Tax=Methyloprofundus sedimenti TaxID=1420851 RepID=A0A1V8M7M7_9GAMM|nr:class III extradiol ring-cleavage dioxygenase [Methyloprofundus sedimenti]OQK17557.1 dioxygenase [Methyloprofundus sedimenti]